MKKKVLKIVILILVVILLLLGAWYVLFVHFDVGPTFPFLPKEEKQLMDSSIVEIAQEPLMATAESEEEAQNIADLYGITLVSFDNGIALYQTDKDIFEVIARGQENGYPELSINYVRTMDGQ